MSVEPEFVPGAMETCEILSWLDLESLENAGATKPELALEEFNLKSVEAKIEADLQT